MGTRSSISLQKNENEIISIYCHWDGYPEWNGALLLKHYNSPEKIEELLELGDLSALRPKVAPADGSEHCFEKPDSDVCIAYCRDRGESRERTKARKHSDYAAVINCYDDCDYHYLYKDSKWWYSVWDSEELKELTREKCKLDREVN